MPHIARNAVFLYLYSIVGAGAGYLFWLVISVFTKPDAVGLASTTSSIAAVAIGFANLGVPSGVQRFLGKAFVDDNLHDFKNYLKASLFLVGLSVTVVSIVLVAMSGLITSYVKLPYEFLTIAIIILITTVFSSTLTGGMTALFQVKTLLIAQVLAHTLRIVVGVTLVLLGMGAFGVAFSYVIIPAIILLILSFSLAKYLSKAASKDQKDISLKNNTKEILRASSANWVPSIIYTLSTNLGVIAVFGAYGAFEAGIYFIASSIFSLVLALRSSIMGVAFPLLSGMSDGRKKGAWRTVRLSLVFCTPLTIAIITYPKALLGIFGGTYTTADLTLTVLLLSIIPLTISSGVSNLVYAYGNYRQVLTIGLAGNIPSIILYLILAQTLGGLGASYANLTGALTGAVAAVIIARMIKMRIIWLDLAKSILIPLVTGLIVYFARLHWLIGGPIILVVSFIGYAKLNLLTKQDLKDLAGAILPKNMAKSIYQHVSWMLNILYKE